MKKLKIAFIVGVFPGLSETFILNQITELLKKGHDVEIFSVRKNEELTHHEIINKLNLMRLVSFFPLVPKNKILRIIKGGFLFIKFFLKNPTKMLKAINFFSLEKDVFSLKILYHIIPFLRKEFDIIHSHFGNTGEIGVFLRKGGMKGKLVTTFYGYDLSTHVNLFGKDVYKELFEHGDLFLPICNYFKKKIVKLFCDPIKIQIHTIGINMDSFNLNLKTHKTNEQVQILSVGRLIEKKGFEYSINALKVLNREKKNFFYTIIGDGPLLKKLKQLVVDLELDDCVKFEGSVTIEALPSYYNVADIFLLPSLTAENDDEEGTPTVLLEAQASGLPVVSTFHSGIPEIVLHKKTGFLVEEKDIKAIAYYLDILISDYKLRREMGNNGRNFVKEKFDIRLLSTVLIDYYKELINKE